MSLAEAEQSYKTIPWPSHVIRSLVCGATDPVFGKEVVRYPNDGLSRLEELSQKGYGSVILLPHFSKGETIRVIVAVSENPVLGTREILVPQGVHQYKKWYGPAGKLTKVTVCPVAIEDTLDYVKMHPEKEPKLRQFLTRQGAYELVSRYVNDGIRVLKEGGVIILFPQGGRRPYLESVTSAVSTLIKRTNSSGVDRFAMMFMGVELESVTNYADSGIAGLNLGRKYKFRVGRTIIKEDFLEETRERGLTVDRFVLEELKLLVPPSYLPGASI